MTAKSAGQKPQLTPGPRASHRYQKAVKSGELIYNGAGVSLDIATGLWKEAEPTDPTQIVHGVADLNDVDHFDNTAGTNTAELLVTSGCVLLTFASVAITDEGKVCYVVDDQTATQTPGGPIYGIIEMYVDATHAYVFVDPLVNKSLAVSAALSAGTRKARLVVTSLSASYTGSGTGTLTGPASTPWPTQDGITNANQAVNDIVFIPEGTANLADPKDAGPWQIVNLAASSGAWVITRPDWWANGGPIQQATVIEISGDGTGTTPRWAGTAWKTWCGKGKIIGTDAPLFWPREISGTYTAVAGVVVNAISTIPIRSTTTSAIRASNQGTASHASTVGPPRVTAVTAGAIGTSALTMKAESAPGTTNASDVGVYTVEVNNG